MNQDHQDSSTAPCGGEVRGTLHFYDAPADGSEPVFTVTHSSGAGLKNYGHHPVPVIIRDLRGQEDKFTLSHHSFAPVSGVLTGDIDFNDFEDVSTRYLRQVENLCLEHVSGSRRVVVFDITIRKASLTELHRPLTNRISEPCIEYTVIFREMKPMI